LADRIIELTATVTKGKYEEIYAILKAMNVYITKSKAEFERRFCDIWQHENKKYWYLKKIKGYKNLDILLSLLEQYVFVVRKSQVASLPPFFIQKRYLEQTKDQLDIINRIYEGEVERLEDIKIFDRVSHNNMIKLALQDTRLVTKKDMVKPSYLFPKAEEIIKMLSEEFCDEKIIIYTQSKKYIKLLSGLIKRNNKVPSFYKNVLEIHGEISVK